VTDTVTRTVGLTTDNTTMPNDIQRLQQANRGEQVAVTYTSPKTADTKTVTGVKTSDGGPIEAAVIDTGDEYRDGTPRTLTVDNGGTVSSSGRVQSQRIGQLVSVSLPQSDDEDGAGNTVDVDLTSQDEVDWNKAGADQ